VLATLPPGRLGAVVAIGVSLGPEVADTKALPVAGERKSMVE
jgi:hypothetical protein